MKDNDTARFFSQLLNFMILGVIVFAFAFMFVVNPQIAAEKGRMDHYEVDPNVPLPSRKPLVGEKLLDWMDDWEAEKPSPGLIRLTINDL